MSFLICVRTLAGHVIWFFYWYIGVADGEFIISSLFLCKYTCRHNIGILGGLSPNFNLLLDLPPSLELAKLNIADITGNEKISYFSYLCTSTVIRQGWTPPGKIFWIGAWLIFKSLHEEERKLCSIAGRIRCLKISNLLK